MKKLLLLSIFLLGACSSPPEAPKVDWDKKEEVMNTQLMAWSPTDHVIKSDVVNGHWQQKITGFVPENRFYNDSVFYAVAHSKRIIVETSGSTAFFTAKNWLRQHGATGLIEYRNNQPCITCNTNIYFGR
ncbi:conjugal transfer protein [Salmonella enterica]|nr:conjugal transfer protein [Salmonella enterica]